MKQEAFDGQCNGFVQVEDKLPVREKRPQRRLEREPGSYRLC